MEKNRSEKHAICIQCHNKPELINALISMFPRDNFDFYIHVDIKSNIIDKITRGDNIFFSKRIDVQWGQSSQVKATMLMLEMISEGKYKYIHLISGNDFVIKSVDEFLDFFKNNDTQYIQSNVLNEKCTWSWHGWDRYQVWYPQFLIKRPCRKLMRLLRVMYREFIMRTVIFKRKRFPVSEFFGGSQWFSITDGMLTWIKSYLNEHEEYMKFFEHSVCCDEVFFSTLVRQSPYADKVANNPLRYMIWDDVNTGGPKELEIEDVDAMVTSANVFARKVTSMAVVDEIIKRIS